MHSQLTLTKAEIEARLPHAGDMCLLDRVVSWEAKKIVCEASTHQRQDNPLRTKAGLQAIHGVEYAAQAAALHMNLVNAGGQSQQGFLGALKSCELFVDRLDDLDSPLLVSAEPLFVDKTSGAFYTFTITNGEEALLKGQLLIVFTGGTTCS